MEWGRVQCRWLVGPSGRAAALRPHSACSACRRSLCHLVFYKTPLSKLSVSPFLQIALSSPLLALSPWVPPSLPGPTPQTGDCSTLCGLNEQLIHRLPAPQTGGNVCPPTQFPVFPAAFTNHRCLWCRLYSKHRILAKWPA